MSARLSAGALVGASNDAYLKGEASREKFYRAVNEESNGLLDSVICEKIDAGTRQQIFGRIAELNGDEEIDLIVGGPPCQAYSVAGRGQAGKKKDEQGVTGKEKLEADDERNYLYRDYAAFLKQFRPKMFVFENVVGLLSSHNGQHLRDLWKAIQEVGYQLDVQRFDATWFGVLQERPRLVIVGWRTDIKAMKLGYPVFERHPISAHTTVQDLLSDLPPLQPKESSNRYLTTPSHYLRHTSLRLASWDTLTHHHARPHRPEDRSIYRLCIAVWDEERRRLLYDELPEELQFHKNRKTHRDRFKVVASDLPYAHTVVAHINKDGHYYIHPELSQARSLTVREAARIQSFPDNYFFEGPRTAAYRQVGNAVPPLMAAAIATGIRRVLEEKSGFIERSSTAQQLDDPAVATQVWYARLVRPSRKPMIARQLELALHRAFPASS